MNFLNDLSIWLSDNVTKGIFMSVLMVIFYHFILKDKHTVNYSSLILKWIILTNILINIISLTLSILENTDSSIIVQRITGPYFWAYWFMFFFSLTFPLSLLLNKFKNKLYWLLLVSLLMNIGWLFESLIIYITSIQREVSTGSNTFSILTPRLLILTKGLLLGFAIIGISRIISKLLPHRVSESQQV